MTEDILRGVQRLVNLQDSFRLESEASEEVVAFHKSFDGICQTSHAPVFLVGDLATLPGDDLCYPVDRGLGLVFCGLRAKHQHDLIVACSLRRQTYLLHT